MAEIRYEPKPFLYISELQECTRDLYDELVDLQSQYNKKSCNYELEMKKLNFIQDTESERLGALERFETLGSFDRLERNRLERQNASRLDQLRMVGAKLSLVQVNVQLLNVFMSALELCIQQSEALNLNDEEQRRREIRRLNRQALAILNSDSEEFRVIPSLRKRAVNDDINIDELTQPRFEQYSNGNKRPRAEKLEAENHLYSHHVKNHPSINRDCLSQLEYYYEVKSRLVSAATRFLEYPVKYKLDLHWLTNDRTLCKCLKVIHLNDLKVELTINNELSQFRSGKIICNYQFYKFWLFNNLNYHRDLIDDAYQHENLNNKFSELRFAIKVINFQDINLCDYYPGAKLETPCPETIINNERTIKRTTFTGYQDLVKLISNNKIRELDHLSFVKSPALGAPAISWNAFPVPSASRKSKSTTRSWNGL